MTRAPATISIAPMLDFSDRHFRYVMRQLSRKALLYTEMITSSALLRGDAAGLLAFDPTEHPIAIQLGGDDPEALAQCARRAVDAGYDEINLNVGCPSDRVQQGRFGASLMAHPRLVAEIVAAIKVAVSVPVTVKHRIGIDQQDSYEELLAFVDTVAGAGCDAFIVHARIALLAGLSPKQNRSVPPLRYDEVYRLKAERPNLALEINGGIATHAEIAAQLRRVDGVMIGRAAVQTPFLFAEIDQRYYGSPEPVRSRREVLEAIFPYLAAHLAAGGRAYQVTRHLLPLFAGLPGNRAWKRTLCEQSNRCDDPIALLRSAMARFDGQVLDRRAEGTMEPAATGPHSNGEPLSP